MLLVVTRKFYLHQQQVDPSGIDLGSTNGTMVNGDSIQASPLLIGDYIEIGDVALRVSLLSE